MRPDQRGPNGTILLDLVLWPTSDGLAKLKSHNISEDLAQETFRNASGKYKAFEYFNNGYKIGFWSKGILIATRPTWVNGEVDVELVNGFEADKEYVDNLISEWKQTYGKGG